MSTNPESQVEAGVSNQTIFFDSALVSATSGDATWQKNVAIEVLNGQIQSIECDIALEDVVSTRNGASVTHVTGIAIPSMPNVHSHAFQRGFVGLSEYRSTKNERATNDSFWTWRNLMYDFVNKLSPDDVYVIAKQLYLEMLKAGYSWVGEFHYLHHDINGTPYGNPAEMLEAVARAANDAGIGICLLPVLYQRSGFGSSSFNLGQRRFASSIDQFNELVSYCARVAEHSTDVSFGVAFHSLRAASTDAIREGLELRSVYKHNLPVHIHAAEQVQEVDDCLANHGQRPVEYLLDQFDVDQNWCLIHATHLNSFEIHQLQTSKAIVGLCPTTEANLGDGFFPARQFLDPGGRISIGSDSHCEINIGSELRTLEYGCRLNSRSRAVLGDPVRSVGRRLYEDVATNGGSAIGIKTGKLAAGYRADILVLDPSHATIAGASDDRALDRFVFSNTGCPIMKRLIGGSWVENDALDALLDESSAAFLQRSKRLLQL